MLFRKRKPEMFQAVECNKFIPIHWFSNFNFCFCVVLLECALIFYIYVSLFCSPIWFPCSLIWYCTSCVVYGIEADAATIDVTASSISVRYRTDRMQDCLAFRHLKHFLRWWKVHDTPCMSKLCAEMSKNRYSYVLTTDFVFRAFFLLLGDQKKTGHGA